MNLQRLFECSIQKTEPGLSEARKEQVTSGQPLKLRKYNELQPH